MWNSMGQLTQMYYPKHWQLQSGSYVQQNGSDQWHYYDWARRPWRLRMYNNYIVDLLEYNAGGQLISGSFLWVSETRQYNERGQLTRQTSLGMDLEYRFSSTANDARLWQRKDHVSGEEVTYQYDQLGRLIAAATTGPEWGSRMATMGSGI